MTDLFHLFGTDLTVSASGDLLLVSGDGEAQQRLLRRLLTAAQGYIQNPTYGAGLGGFVGRPAAAAKVAGVIKSQAKKEASIAQNPPPQVACVADSGGNLTCTLSYTDALTNQPSTLTFPVSS